MDERSQVLIATVLGAVCGGVLGSLYLTERGRHIREQIEPTLDAMLAEFQRTQMTVIRVREATREGRRAFDDLLSQPPSREPGSPWESREFRKASP